MLTVAVFSTVLGKLCVKSHHGLTRIAPAGTGNFVPVNPLIGAGKLASRITWSKARTRFPPAESPLMIICEGGTGLCSAPGGGFMR